MGLLYDGGRYALSFSWVKFLRGEGWQVRVEWCLL